MQVTQVSILPTEAARAAGRPALTPELLAASGARYSRNNEGLEAILAKIDPDNLDRSVDGIFRMIDYGHQSIADMAPVAMFIDEISILLAYLIWSWCPTAAGQESSTRYLKLDQSGLVDPELFGLSEEQRPEWSAFMTDCFAAYEQALEFWERIGTQQPELTLIPAELLHDTSIKAEKQVARMKRNFAFDRSRYFLPVAAKTNIMLIMSSRGWVQLCQNLLSHWLPEARLLGEKIRAELELSAPRMVRHATRTRSFAAGRQAEFVTDAKAAQRLLTGSGAAECLAATDIYLPCGITEEALILAMQEHDNRYAFIGSAACRTAVRFAWTAMTLGEIRDLNRHRTGQKYCPLVPQGFYCAADQLPSGLPLDTQLLQLGDRSTRISRSLLTKAESAYAAWLLLGTQFPFEHTTTLDKFIYEAELRTGVGAHFRYAHHLRQTVEALGRQYPALAAAIPLGTNEPE